MSLTPLPPENTQGTIQVLLAYLEDSRNVTPNDMLEGIVSAKSLCRALLKGDLVICGQVVAPPDPPPGKKKTPAKKKTARKKTGK